MTGLRTSPQLVGTPVEQRALRFEDRADGAVSVFLAESGVEVETLAPGTNGFIRGVLRGLARERRARGVGREPAFEITRWDDGRLSLEDLATGRTIDLSAFGPTNTAAFARLLGAEPRS